MRKNFCWLIGENISKTHNNNSYYFWKNIVTIKDGIDKYYILRRNKENLKFAKGLPTNERKYIVWKNSIKHTLLFNRADMFFVSLSYRDITPGHIFCFKFKRIIKKPLIYLQHGVLGLKKIGYTGKAYNNNIARFVYYNKDIKDIFAKENNFKDYQLYYGKYQPRYQELLRQSIENGSKKEILFFFTWREYFADQPEKLNAFIQSISDVLSDKKMQNFLEDNGYRIKIIFHAFYKDDQLRIIKENTRQNSRIQLISARKTDIMPHLASAKLLVTDYSSVAYDFTFLEKPVILFQTDFKEYLNERSFYCDIDYLKRESAHTAKELIHKICSEKWMVNDFFRKAFPEKIDQTEILNGDFIYQQYNYFKNLQENKITFLGYNFFGQGGTITATKAQAESLAEKGFLIELISFKGTRGTISMPYGISLRAFYNLKENRIKTLLIRLALPKFLSKRFFKYDSNANLIPALAIRKMKKYISTSLSKTFISTRESIHLLLDDATNPYTKNKLYIYHCDPVLLDTVFPGLKNEIKQRHFSNAYFVTEKAKNSYEEKCCKNYDKSFIIGNSLSSNETIRKDEIGINNIIDKYYPPIKDEDGNIIPNIIESKKLQILVLTRLSKDRTETIKNIIDLGNYIKRKKLNIELCVFGKGDRVSYFESEIANQKLSSVISYMGSTSKPQKEILRYGRVVDLSPQQSFGMTYIEAILNGADIYAMHNTGSNEVLKNFPECYYESWEDLCSKLPQISTKERKIERYNFIEKTYSRSKIADELIKSIN